MNISQVAKLTSLSAKSIRFYESQQIVESPLRSSNGYRVYNDVHIEQLKLVARAKAVGFSLEDCKSLVLMSQDPNRTSADIKKKAQQKLDDVEEKLAELNNIKRQLNSWIDECPGDSSPCCPIMDNLQGKCGE
ncbi:Cu(I)-responsive transcriptional regulator [Vibrio algicola]|uniref:HTH-type transcriptional regulator CueR n=1 Tax=Vibrio algicola TaxID=2662262 RepID=A0A5Q0TL18_9VIBR|nr:Cu(I)-responsive transcriptional regulator [Vibrio algicola]